MWKRLPLIDVSDKIHDYVPKRLWISCSLSHRNCYYIPKKLKFLNETRNLYAFDDFLLILIFMFKYLCDSVFDILWIISGGLDFLTKGVNRAELPKSIECYQSTQEIICLWVIFNGYIWAELFLISLPVPNSTQRFRKKKKLKDFWNWPLSVKIFSLICK